MEGKEKRQEFRLRFTPRKGKWRPFAKHAGAVFWEKKRGKRSNPEETGEKWSITGICPLDQTPNLKRKGERRGSPWRGFSPMMGGKERRTGGTGYRRSYRGLQVQGKKKALAE